MVKRASSSSLPSISFPILILVLLVFAIIDMADSAPNSSSGSSSPKSAVHIVYTERPQQNEEPEAYHIRTLASVLGRSALSLSLCEIYLFFLSLILKFTVRRLPRRLWFIVTRRPPVDSLLSSLLNRSSKSQVSLLSLFSDMIALILFYIVFVLTCLE